MPPAINTATIPFQYMLLLRGATELKEAVKDYPEFQYMLLLRGATSRAKEIPSSKPFQYMLLLRGATVPAADGVGEQNVSIHAPLARSNDDCAVPRGSCGVSIHAPLARSNSRMYGAGLAHGFQYMLLLRGATTRKLRLMSFWTSFNTCSSCEEQLSCHWFRAPLILVQYMLLLRGATWRPTLKTSS